MKRYYTSEVLTKLPILLQSDKVDVRPQLSSMNLSLRFDLRKDGDEFIVSRRQITNDNQNGDLIPHQDCSVFLTQEQAVNRLLILEFAYGNYDEILVYRNVIGDPLKESSEATICHE